MRVMSYIVYVHMYILYIHIVSHAHQIGDKTLALRIQQASGILS